MKEILFAIFAPQLLLIPIVFAVRRSRSGEAGQVGEAEDRGAEVLSVVYRAYASLRSQGAAGYGPWLSSVISHGGGDASVALTAVRWTIRDLEGRRFDLGGLLEAEAVLEEMTGDGE